ncbi:LysR family transcriptional regulator [Rhodobacteraceae bacterium DSL-40]|uniref:LysR family transcriptional regulator n=1 Tax=Amaricoccus sp. B4 TaxID=3368557 RepID=UPI000DAF30D9
MLASLSAADLRALHVFRTISRCRSFAGAERELDISQSTISAQLSGLERRLGFRLCERGPGGFRLTERGRTTLDAYARLEGAMNEFLQTTSDLSHRVVGTLRLGMLDHTSTDPGFSVVGLVRLFHERAPDVRLEITQDIQTVLASRIDAKSLDLAIGAFPVGDDRFDTVPLYLERQHIYCGPPHPLFRDPEAPVEAAVLEAADWVGRSYDLAPADGEAPRLGRVAANAANLEAVTVILRALPTLGYLPDHVAAPLVARGELRRLTDRFAISYQISLLSRRGRRDTAPMKRFRALATAEAQSRDG